MNLTKKARILIVDDDPVNVEIICEILGSDYNLATANGGREAVSSAEQFKPDIILLDIMMPDINGYEVCRIIRRNKELKLTKIILVSAKQMLEDRLEGYKAGADEYISKPFDAEELKAKIKIFLRLKSVEEIEKIKSGILNIFSHETKTPLHSIVGFSNFLLEQNNLPASQREALTHIYKSGRKILDIVEKTILLTAIKDGSKTVRIEIFNLLTLLKTIVAAINTNTENSYQLDFTADEQKIYIEADRELLNRAIIYLIEYACSKEKNDKTTFKIHANKHDDNVKIRIETNNTFFSETAEFTVADISHHNSGSGLGFSIALQIIKTLKGNINILSQDDPDTGIIEISLPVLENNTDHVNQP